jgi:hypothetical protein
MRRLSFDYVPLWLCFLIGILPILSITSCAAVGSAPSWTPCQHPLIDPSTDHGVYRAILSYQREVDDCNALNGFEVTE